VLRLWPAPLGDTLFIVALSQVQAARALGEQTTYGTKLREPAAGA
jgi:hypothetical protein